MATHPSNQFPTRTVVLDEAQSFTGDIYAIQVLVAENATMVVQGKNLFEYINIDAESAANVVKWINPNTGQAFTGTAEAAGFATTFYQRIDGVDVTLPCVANSIVYGEFSKVTATANDRFLLHIK